jgi:hypothetical protein
MKLASMKPYNEAWLPQKTRHAVFAADT